MPYEVPFAEARWCRAPQISHGRIGTVVGTLVTALAVAAAWPFTLFPTMSWTDLLCSSPLVIPGVVLVGWFLATVTRSVLRYFAKRRPVGVSFEEIGILADGRLIPYSQVEEISYRNRRVVYGDLPGGEATRTVDGELFIRTRLGQQAFVAYDVAVGDFHEALAVLETRCPGVPLVLLR